MHYPTDRIIHTTAFVTPVVKHWLEREIAQWVHPMKDRSPVYECKKGNVSHDDAINTFDLVTWHQTYGLGLVTNITRRNPLPLIQGLFFSIVSFFRMNQKLLFAGLKRLTL